MNIRILKKKNTLNRAKYIADKIGVIENLINKCDYLLIGGGMAFTFIKALSNIFIAYNLLFNFKRTKHTCPYEPRPKSFKGVKS